MPQKVEEFKPTKSAMAAIVAGVLVIITGFLMYNYFSKVEDKLGEITEESKTTESVEKLVTPEEMVKEVLNNKNEKTEIKKEWKAINYKSGDITGNAHTVVRGDTLWEIAEGRYGNGYMWTKILEANKDKISFLPNGNPLITPGQVLILPD